MCALSTHGGAGEGPVGAGREEGDQRLEGVPRARVVELPWTTRRARVENARARSGGRFHRGDARWAGCGYGREGERRRGGGRPAGRRAKGRWRAGRVRAGSGSERICLARRQDCAHAPRWLPRLWVVCGDGEADLAAGLEAAVGREHIDGGRLERVVVREHNLAVVPTNGSSTVLGSATRGCRAPARHSSSKQRGAFHSGPEDGPEQTSRPLGRWVAA